MPKVRSGSRKKFGGAAKAYRKTKNTKFAKKGRKGKTAKKMYKKSMKKINKKYSTKTTVGFVKKTGKVSGTQKSTVIKLNKVARQIVKAADLYEKRLISGVFENQAAGFLMDSWATTPTEGPNYNTFDFAQFMDDRLFNMKRDVQNCNRQIFDFFSPRWVNLAHNTLYDPIATSPPIQPPTLQDADVKNKNIFVHSAFGHIYLKNDTYVPKEITFYLCRPKENEKDDPFTDLKHHISLDKQAGRYLMNEIEDVSNNTNNRCNRYGFDPSWVTVYDKHWEVVKKVIMLEPGARYDFSIEGPKNTNYEYRKFKKEGTLAEGEDLYYDYPKGFGLYGYYTVKALEVQGLWADQGTIGPTIPARTGSNSHNTADQQKANMFGITCRVKHWYKISPDDNIAEQYKIKGKYWRGSTGINKVGLNGFATERVDPKLVTNIPIGGFQQNSARSALVYGPAGM